MEAGDAVQVVEIIRIDVQRPPGLFESRVEITQFHQGTSAQVEGPGVVGMSLQMAPGIFQAVLICTLGLVPAVQGPIGETQLLRGALGPYKAPRAGERSGTGRESRWSVPIGDVRAIIPVEPGLSSPGDGSSLHTGNRMWMD
jgi:hypothetical protein